MVTRILVCVVLVASTALTLSASAQPPPSDDWTQWATEKIRGLQDRRCDANDIEAIKAECDRQLKRVRDALSLGRVSSIPASEGQRMSGGFNLVAKEIDKLSKQDLCHATLSARACILSLRIELIHLREGHRKAQQQ